MKDPVSEGGEASDAEADALENLGLVVAALGESVGVRDIKAVENVLVPIAHKCAVRPSRRGSAPSGARVQCCLGIIFHRAYSVLSDGV